MTKVIGVRFKEGGKIYYFSPNKFKLKKRITVVVETERGLQMGWIATDPLEIDESKLDSPLHNIIRIATKQDYKKYKRNLADAREAVKVCKKLVKKNGLNMIILDANFTLDRNQLLFHFLADGRVDFRNLAKDLAAIYKTRIELRQIGVRDKAKMIGGIGHCGRILCCKAFLNKFENISINMAKNQNLSLNPSKVNGACGRLLCCLKYEDENYKCSHEKLPKIGSTVQTEQGEGLVVAVDILEKKYKVDVPNVGIIEVKVEENECSK
ncbi:MAG: stage 0 sporulation family protein [Mollicutes bacterium]|nr:stage 0 sporulation family protein [Mollicutes bacterium]